MILFARYVGHLASALAAAAAVVVLSCGRHGSQHESAQYKWEGFSDKIAHFSSAERLIIWIYSLMRSFGRKLPVSPLLYIDNRCGGEFSPPVLMNHKTDFAVKC